MCCFLYSKQSISKYNQQANIPVTPVTEKNESKRVKQTEKTGNRNKKEKLNLFKKMVSKSIPEPIKQKQK